MNIQLFNTLAERDCRSLASRKRLRGVIATAGVLAVVMILAGCDTGSSASKTPAGGACVADGDCAAGLICAGVVGSQVCSAAGDGMGGSVCGTDSHCADRLACSAGACKVAAGGACVIDNTDTTGDCAAGLVCAIVSGSDVCAASDGSAGSACAINSDCDTNLICASVSGSTVCAQSDGSAGSACVTSSNCDTNLICAVVSGSTVCSAVGDGSAGSICGFSSHCDYACIVGLCTDGTAGTGCGNNSDCASGVCSSFVCQ